MFTLRVQVSTLLCLFCGQVLCAGNPIMRGADPHAIVLGDTVWIYPTWSDGRGERFFAFSSTDLTNWQRHGPVLDLADVAWIKEDGQERHHAWAPAMLVRGGKYYFYYSVGPQNPTPSRIGVAVGDGPQGPFHDSGRPLLTGGDGFEAIDPMAFADPQSGKVYLYAGGSAGAKLRVFELNPDLTSIAREIPVETPPQFTEGVFMHCRDGRYYLSYSHGGWRNSSYSVHYATADAPTGPWTYRGAILVSDQTHKGPGHHSFIQSPLDGRWRIVYHRWENQTGDGPYRGSRQICIDAVEYDADGLIRPIAMTNQSAGQAAGTFTNPINPGPDPWLRYHRGNYYLTTTQGNGIRMWKAPTLAELKTAPGTVVWRDDDPTRSHGIWAPEFHLIDGRWCLYYTAMAATKVDTTHRMHVLESEGDDPLGPYQYKGRLFDPANDFYSIDGSVFRHPGDGAWYFLWAAHPGHRIRIAKMANPWTLEGPSVQLEASGFGCEEVREGPVVLHRNGRLFLTYSACDTGKPDYKLGMLIADELADVMDPCSWVQHPEPVFERNDAAGVFGPGHHGFFQSPDGTEDWIVYHGKTSSSYTYAGRTTRAQKFTWSDDGLPVFGKPLSLDTVLAEPSNRKKDASGDVVLEYENPLWDGYLADPQVLRTGGEYYAYGTGPEHGGRQFPVLHSKDFTHWEFVGNALETLADPKVKAYWAPEVAEKDGKFYLYYAGEYQMRVAVADHPAGPFKDTGRILFPDEPFSIDGHPYRDPQSGKWYLFFAKDFLDGRVGTALAVAELSDDMISTAGRVTTVLRAVGDWQIYERNRTMYGRVFDAWHTVEAPFVVLREGRYYCFYSGGNWQTPGYGVGFAVADRVTGPYKDEADLQGAAVLKSVPGKLIGPGHNSVVLAPDGRTHFIVYHSWNPERTRRQMCMDPIVWTPEGPRPDNPSRGKRVVVLPGTDASR